MYAKEKAASIALRGPVNTMLLAQAHAELVREKIDKMHRAVLAERIYTNRYTAERISEPKSYWLMHDNDAKVYHAECKRQHAIMGYGREYTEEGFCPALVAENLFENARRAVVLAAEQFFPGVTAEKLLCAANGIERYKQYADLIVKLVVNHPSYAKPAVPNKRGSL